jgi:hypothetical protein
MADETATEQKQPTELEIALQRIDKLEDKLGLKPDTRAPRQKLDDKLAARKRH